MNISQNRVLKIHNFFDFCIRCDEIYEYFWDFYAPFFDFAEYRDYLLYKVHFHDNKDKQEMYAGFCWEYLMGDILKSELYGSVRFKDERNNENNN